MSTFALCHFICKEFFLRMSETTAIIGSVQPASTRVAFSTFRFHLRRISLYVQCYFKIIKQINKNYNIFYNCKEICVDCESYNNPISVKEKYFQSFTINLELIYTHIYLIVRKLINPL